MMQVAGKESWLVPIESAASLAGVSVRVIRLLVERRRLVCQIEDDVELIGISSLVRYLNERPDALRLPPKVHSNMEERYV